MALLMVEYANEPVPAIPYYFSDSMGFNEETSVR